MNLEKTIQKFQEKDTQAFENLYAMYKDSLFGVIFNIVKDHEIAEEVLQDVFLKAWNKASTYQQNKGRIFTWLLNIARNTAIDKTRSKTFKNDKKNFSLDFYVDKVEQSDGFLDNTEISGIKKFVNHLTEKCKSIINLLYFKGLTQKDTAETLEIPLGTVKTRNRTCLNKLKDLLASNK